MTLIIAFDKKDVDLVQCIKAVIKFKNQVSSFDYKQQKYFQYIHQHIHQHIHHNIYINI